MSRRILSRPRPLCLSATCTKDSDRELIRNFRAMAAVRGLSVQQALLQAAREWLGASQ